MVSELFSQIVPVLGAGGSSHYTKLPALMSDPVVQKIALAIFALAICHTFMVSKFLKLSHKYPHDSVSYKVCHILGEVEAVFGIWALILIFIMAGMYGEAEVKNYLTNQINFTEPALVFVIMTIAATLPVIYFANRCITAISKLLPMPTQLSFYFSALIIGPLLGSFITEPAAMTVTAIILKRAYYDKGISTKFMYATLGVLFVNVSIGGTLTHFAAPPVLMVANTWSWDMSYMMGNFGWKSAIAVVINTALISFMFRKELLKAPDEAKQEKTEEKESIKVLPSVIFIQMMFLFAVVYFSHDMVVFLAIFIFFLGWCEITSSYQEPLKVKSALLVGFFLAGLVVLGKMQAWWLKPLLGDIEPWMLYIGTSLLTGITDNAALTYLGTTVDGLSLSMKYALVAGAVAGGGLTVIANAPNPAGFGILKSSFGEDGISPLGLLKASALPTVVAMLCLWFLGNPYPPKTDGEGKANIVEVVSLDKFKIENKEYSFEKLQKYFKDKAAISEGNKLKLVFMLPDGKGSKSKDAESKASMMKMEDLQKLLQKLNDSEIHKVKAGQIVLQYDLKEGVAEKTPEEPSK